MMKMEKKNFDRVEVWLGCVDFDITETQILNLGECSEEEFAHIERQVFKGPMDGRKPCSVKSEWELEIEKALKVLKGGEKDVL